jgi:hypothetical protein
MFLLVPFPFPKLLAGVKDITTTLGRIQPIGIATANQDFAL